MKIRKLAIVTTLVLASVVPVLAQNVSPSVKIISPPDSAIYGKVDYLEFAFETENFTFVDFKSNTVPFPGNPNAGHAYIWIDTPLNQQTPDNAALKVLSVDAVNLGGIDAGQHTATMELVGNDNNSYSPRVLDTVTFRTTEKIPGKVAKLDYKSDKVDISNVETTTPTARAYLFFALAVVLIAGIVYFLRRRVRGKGIKGGNRKTPETPKPKENNVIQM